MGKVPNPKFQVPEKIETSIAGLVIRPRGLNGRQAASFVALLIKVNNLLSKASCLPQTYHHASLDLKLDKILAYFAVAHISTGPVKQRLYSVADGLAIGFAKPAANFLLSGAFGYG